MHQRKDRGQQQQSDGHEHTNEVALPILLTSAGDGMQRTNVKRRLDSTGFKQTEVYPMKMQFSSGTRWSTTPCSDKFNFRSLTDLRGTMPDCLSLLKAQDFLTKNYSTIHPPSLPKTRLFANQANKASTIHHNAKNTVKNRNLSKKGQKLAEN